MSKRILITGGTGMVGSAFKNMETDHELILVGSKDCDLMDYDRTFKMFAYYMPNAVIHLAAKVGGVKGNSDYVADYFHENIMMNTNVLDISRRFRIGKVLSLLSACIYPENPTYPLTEDQIHDGEPHKSAFGYAYSKRMLEVHSRAIRQQYGLKYITAIPNNIYGQNDNFSFETGHVVPAMIRKLHDAKLNGQKVKHWGTGAPKREFTYSKDIARALLLLVEDYEGVEPINIGSSFEISIFNLAGLISEIIGYDGDELWDASMPEGQYEKPSSNKKFMKLFPNFVYTPFAIGLRETIEWYVDNYPDVRL